VWSPIPSPERGFETASSAFADSSSSTSVPPSSSSGVPLSAPPFWAYLGAAVGCVILTLVYGLFGHGVRSWAMDLMWIFPLAGGTTMWGFSRMHPAYQGMFRFGANLFNSGIATLSVHGLLAGILEIAGSDSPYLSWFLVVGVVLSAVGLACLGFGAARQVRTE
jgi:hypothetical protein